MSREARELLRPVAKKALWLRRRIVVDIVAGEGGEGVEVIRDSTDRWRSLG
jgi:hypothetical protein